MIEGVILVHQINEHSTKRSKAKHHTHAREQPVIELIGADGIAHDGKQIGIIIGHFAVKIHLSHIDIDRKQWAFANEHHWHTACHKDRRHKQKPKQAKLFLTTEVDHPKQGEQEDGLQFPSEGNA